MAARAGVSTATVSKYVNQGDYYIADATKQRIAEAIAELDYEPSATARGLVNRRTRAIGVVIASFDNPFYAELIAGVDDVIGSSDYTLVVASSSDDSGEEAAVVQAMRQRQVEGMVLASVTSESREIAKALRSGIDVVLASRISSDLTVDAVVSDDEGGAVQAVDHLIGHGHTRIGHIAGPPTITPFRMRAAGFRSGCHRAGISLDERLVATTRRATMEAGEEMAGQLLDLDEAPTAVFAGNDRLALGALRAMEKRRLRVPRDVAVVGFDNVWVSSVPGVDLSTVDASTRDLGRIAARRLIDRIERRWAHTTAPANEPTVQILPTTFIARRTCGC